VASFFRSGPPTFYSEQQRLSRQKKVLLDADLAERLSDAVKIAANSCIYSTLLPLAWAIGALALTLTFFVDRYLTLRRWRVRALDSRLVKIALSDLLMFGPLIHFGVNLALMRGWPMDEVVLQNGVLVKVDKSLPGPGKQQHGAHAHAIAQPRNRATAQSSRNHQAIITTLTTASERLIETLHILKIHAD
jgi:hypothetical protein